MFFIVNFLCHVAKYRNETARSAENRRNAANGSAFETGYEPFARSCRSLSDQQLSNLLWAAWGINRPDGRRTAASAMNRQEIDLYLVGRKAAYLYDAKEHSLKLVAEGDHRSEVSSQDFAKNGDWDRHLRRRLRQNGRRERSHCRHRRGPDRTEHIPLWEHRKGLGVVVHASVDRDTISKVLKLRPAQHIMIAQTVGIPTR